MNYPEEFRYTASHEYIHLQAGIAVVGITAFAVDQLGDIVFVDLPKVGTTLQKGQPFGTVESVKAVEDLYAPISGVVQAINQAVIDNPEQLAKDPYGEGWLLQVQVADASELSDTMTSVEYQSKVEGL
ncbi:MAG: glycine cleavage system protein GcvH [Pseudanabaenaceae cyanobacterium]